LIKYWRLSVSLDIKCKRVRWQQRTVGDLWILRETGHGWIHCFSFLMRLSIILHTAWMKREYYLKTYFMKNKFYENIKISLLNVFYNVRNKNVFIFRTHLQTTRIPQVEKFRFRWNFESLILGRPKRR